MATLVDPAWRAVQDRFTALDFAAADLSGASLRGVRLPFTRLHDADLRGAQLAEADLQYAKLARASLESGHFEDANLRNADLTDARASGCDFFRACLFEVSGDRVDLSGANLDKADLRGAKLVSANLASASLRMTQARGANLRHADLTDADLTGTDMAECDLRETKLAGLRGLPVCATGSLVDASTYRRSAWTADDVRAWLRAGIQFLGVDGLPKDVAVIVGANQHRDVAALRWELVEPVRVFVAYSRQDVSLRDRLVRALEASSAQHILDVWYDDRIKVGSRWDEGILAKLDEAGIVLFLVTENLLASSYVLHTEMPRAFERAKAESCDILPIVFGSVSWKGLPIHAWQGVLLSAPAELDDMQWSACADQIRTLAMARGKPAGPISVVPLTSDMVKRLTQHE